MRKVFIVFLFLFMFCLLPLSACAKSQNILIDGDHGKLSAVLQTPDEKDSYDLVMLLHGFTSSKEDPIIKTAAEKLDQNGIASLRFDFNGHGESEGEFQDMTVLNEIEDAKKVYDYAKKLPQVKTISILGHSQGGVVSSMTAGELGTAAFENVVLMAPAAVLREDSARGSLFGVAFDPSNPPEYVELNLGKIYRVGQNYMKVAAQLEIFETASKYEGNVCLIHGTSDNIVPYTYSIYYDKWYKNSELHLLKGLDHGFSQDLNQAVDVAVNFLVGHLK